MSSSAGRGRGDPAALPAASESTAEVLRRGLVQLREASTRPLAAEPARAASGSRSILLVDDDAATAGIVREILEEAGHRVADVPTIAEAKRQILEAGPDLVVTDLVLPDGDGLTFCAWLRERSSIPILVLSGTARARDPVLALKLGADQFLAKPFDIAELEARVGALLRRAGEGVGSS